MNGDAVSSGRHVPKGTYGIRPSGEMVLFRPSVCGSQPYRMKLLRRPGATDRPSLRGFACSGGYEFDYLRNSICFTVSRSIPHRSSYNWDSTRAYSVPKKPVTWPVGCRAHHDIERVRRVAGQADISGAVDIGLRTVAGDIGESAFKPDIQLITGMAAVRDGVIGRNPKQDLPSAFGEVAAQCRDLDARW